MAENEEIQVNFTLENNEINAQYSLNNNNEIEADFVIKASGTTWGSISGEIENQTDLIELLNTKQDTIEDLDTIRSNADTALQPGDDITKLNNNAGFISGITSEDVTTALGYTPYDSTNPSGYQANVIEIIKVNNTAQTVTDKAVDITVPTTAADVGALPDTTTINDLTTETQMDAIDSGANTTNIGQITTNANDITAINNKIPSEASSSNQLADKSYVDTADGNLQSQINDLKARGRFLALWNASTGLAESNPPESPYTYQSGDYFIVGTISTATPPVNYKPTGSSYSTGVASTVVETAALDVDDVYYYDGTQWRLQVNTQKTTSFVNIAGSPYDNTNLASALNAKQDTITNYVTTNTAQTISGDKKLTGKFQYPAGKTYITTADGSTNLGYWTSDIDGGSNITFQTMTASSKDINFKTNNSGKLTYNGSEVAKLSDVPTVNDGKLALQVNSVDVGEFTANQSTATTVNITVPTDTSDLTNGAKFVDDKATGSQSIALGSMAGASGIGSIAYGYSSSATSTYSMAIGWDASATNTNTIAIGKGASASQSGAIAIGSGAESNASYAYSIGGINNTANSFQVYTYQLLDTSTGLIPDARISTNIARSSDIPAAQVNSDWNAISGVAEILNKPSLSTVATSGSYNDLSDKPTIPTVNNATLTIQKNGTTVNTFTANASTNVTANITVPTDTSDLTNGAGFLASADLKTINSTSIVGSGNIDTTEIFVATYGTTTFSAISTAYSGGKTVFCIKDTVALFILSACTNTLALFYRFGGTTDVRTVEVDTTDTWSNDSDILATTDDLNNKENISNKTTNISDTSTDTQYPSAKAVYNKLHPLKGYLESGTSYTDTTLYNDVNYYAHSTFDKSKFTVVGSPTIADGIVSEFSSSNYITISTTIDTTKKFNIKCKFTSPSSSVSGNKRIIKVLNSTLMLALDGSNLRLWLGNGSSWSIIEHEIISSSITTNTDYTVVIEFTGTQYKVYLNGTLAQTYTGVSIGQTLTTIDLGNDSGSTSNYFSGSIDLKQFSITVDGIPVFSGNQTGIDTVKPDDYTVVGTPTISVDGIASGFSSANYITIPYVYSNSVTNYVERIKFTTGNDVSTRQSIRGINENANKGIGIAVNNGKLNYRIGTGSSWNQNNSISISANTTYIVVFEQTSTTSTFKLYSANNTLLDTTTVTYTSLVYSQTIFGLSKIWPSDSFGGSIDLNAYQVYINGSLVYQPCLKIPYTLSNTGSKIVDVAYRDRVLDVYNQFGSALYYIIDETNQKATLPMGEVYGLITQCTDKYKYDGQWVDSHSQLADGTTYPTSTDIEYSLSTYLPNDGYKYEVLLSGIVTTGTASANFLRLLIKSDLIASGTQVCTARTRTTSSVTGSGNLIIPVGSARKITVPANAAYVGTFSLDAVGYRRIGTNT